MADGYDALEAATNAFGGAPDRSSDLYRRRSDRDDRGPPREERRHRSDRPDRERSDRDRGGYDDRGYDRDRRDRGDRGGGGGYDRRDRGGYERDRGYGGGGRDGRERSPPMMHDRRDRDRDDRRGGGGYGGRDDYGRGGDRDRGGRGGDRGDRRGGVRDKRDEYFDDAGRGRSPTPEHSVPLSERQRLRETKWDIRPAGFEEYSAAAAKQTGHFPAPGPNRQPIPPMLGNPGFPGTLTFTPPPPVPGQPLVSMTGVPLSVHNPGGLAGISHNALPMAGNPIRQSKRLYVGNVGFQCNEQMIADFFNMKMREQRFAVDMPGEPVLNVQLNHEKSYAFVEFRIPEEATSAMAFDGIIFQGTPLKIRRPKDYVGPEGPPGSIHIPGVVSTTVQDTPNKIYIGGLPTYLNDEQVMELLKSFGELKSFNLVKEGAGQTGPSKGFAFCEYVDTAVTDMAIQGLNGFVLGDRTLMVQRASQGRSSQANLMGGAGTSANAAPLGVPTSLRDLAPNILGAASGPAVPTSRVLLMLNMVSPDELVNDDDFNDILEDINEECGKYGEIEGVRVPRPMKKDDKRWLPGVSASEARAAAEKADQEAGVGKVFVLFKDIDGVSRAMNQLAGRSFGGRTIIVANVSEEEFFAGLDGPPPSEPPPPAE